MGTRSVNLSAWVIILACFAFLNLGFARNAYCKNDNALGDPVGISSYKLIDVLNGNIITESFDVPKVGDAEQIYAYVDYYYGESI